MIKFIKNDYQAHPVRFIAEVIAWALSISCSFIMMLTVPNPPLILLYIMWIIGCGLNFAGALSRKSFGISANYLGLVIIDIIALMRMLWL